MTDSPSGHPDYGQPPQPPEFPAPAAPAAPPGAYDVPVGGYAPPVGGYAAPDRGYAVPVGGYDVPVGGYAPPPAGYALPPIAPPAPRTLGALALIAGLLALLVIPVIAGILAFQIGATVPIDDVLTPGGDVDLGGFVAVRGLVLACEIMFWLGTVLGLFAIVVGIIATAKRRGRGMGITGMILAVFGPLAFFFVIGVLWGIGNAVSFPQLY